MSDSGRRGGRQRGKSSRAARHRAHRSRPAWVRSLREVVVVTAIALVAAALLRAYVGQAFYVPSSSMRPTIAEHDRIVVSRLSHLARGEVVVFEDPGGWLSPADQPSEPGPLRRLLEWTGVLPNSGRGYLVKRVIGLPGDHVVCCSEDGRLTINGKPITESYLDLGTGPADDIRFDVVVPAGRMFVLGDNRYKSGDSTRHFSPSSPNAAFVAATLVTGRAVAIIWPWKDRRVLRIPKAFADIPAGVEPPAVASVSTKGPND